MKVTTEELERCEVLLTIEFDPQKEQDLLKKAARRIARKVKIPGFRPGKAPFSTVVRRFGVEAIQQEALEDMSDKVIKDALDEADIQPVAQIQLDDVGWDPLVFKLKVPTKPVVELDEYREIRLEAAPVEVTDADINDTLSALQEKNATWTPVERPSEIGDLISMTVTEQDGDTVLVDNESGEYELTPPDKKDETQPDLTTPLLGLRAGESKTFTLNYPEDFNNKDYAGKEITVSVEVSGVKAKELDPLDDDFAQEVSDFDTLDELKENIRSNLKKRREQERDSKLGAEVLDKIIDGAQKLDWPLALEEAEIDDDLKRAERQLQDMGLTMESFLQMKHKTKEEWREETRENVVTRLKKGLVLGKVAELEGLEVSQSEILEQAKALADYSGGGDQLWRSILASEAQQGFIANDLISNKALLLLAAIAKGEAPEPGSAVEAEINEKDDKAEAPVDDSLDEVTAETVAESPEAVEAEEANETEESTEKA